MSTAPREGASAPRTLRHASFVALVLTPAATAALVLWFMMASDGSPEPMFENLVFLLPVVGVTFVASGALLSLGGTRGPFWTGALVALAATFGVVFSLESHTLVGEVSLLFLAFPALLVFAALILGARTHRARLRLPVAWAVVVAGILLADVAMRYPAAQMEQVRAADELATYDTVHVLDAPGWTLNHAYNRSAFPELVYRDLLGRTVLLGSTPDPLPETDTDGSILSDGALGPERCPPTGNTEEDFEIVDCEEQAGMLVVRMEGTYTDRGRSDDTDRWPFGWTEVRMESADGRYVRLRSDSPGLDLVGLAESIDEAAPTDPEAAAAKASCVLECPVWSDYD